MTTIDLEEFRHNTTEIAERAEKGERFTVVKRSKPMFNIIPLTPADDYLKAWLENYIRENPDILESLADK